MSSQGSAPSPSPIVVEDWQAIIAHLDLSPLAGKTLLLTGASGLIGSYLAGPIGLANRDNGLGCRVICVNRSGLPADLVTLPGLEPRPLDLAAPFEVADKVDYIIHAACPAQPSLWFADRMSLFELNVSATRRLLDLARQHQATMLFCSSAETYGDPPAGTGPIPEDYAGAPRATATRAIYGETKRMAEVMGIVYREDHKVRAISARISHLYGPGIPLEDKRVFADFMRQAMAGDPIRLRDAGRAIKSLGYIADAAEMLLRVLLYGTQPIYNVGGESQITVFDLARRIAELAGGAEVLLPEKAANEPHIGSDAGYTSLDLTRYEQEFGAVPLTKLDVGLARMIEWNRDRGRRLQHTECH